MAIKDRKVFGYRNFRGLDTENKALKVASFRAVDGYNFMIDSETLRTRPSLKLYDYLPFELENNDYLIDLYQTGDVIVYVTRYHFYFYDTTRELSQTAGSLNPFKENDVIQIPPLLEDTFIKGNFSPIDNSDREPLFIEEKDALFIFCVNNIYVFGKLYNSNENYFYTFYELNNRPNNELIVDMPSAYEPTIFIGDNPLDDINLLSNVSKYKLFANVETNNGDIKFNLPTHFEENKHGGFNAEVDFYKGNFDNLQVFPVFLGILGENFLVDSSNLEEEYGNIINISSPTEISDTFYSNQTNDYMIDSNDNITVIKEEFGLTKKEFFDFRVNGRTTFEFLIDLIRREHFEDKINRLYKFRLKVNYSARYVDENERLVRLKKEEKLVDVYIQIHSIYNILSWAKRIELRRFNTSVGSDDMPFPIYPTPIANYEEIPNLITQPINSNDVNSSLNIVKAEVDKWIRNNLNDLENGDKLYTKYQMQHFYSETIPGTVILGPTSNWLVNESSGSNLVFPPYNIYPTLESANIYDLNAPLDVNNISFINDIINDIKNRAEPSSSGYYGFKALYSHNPSVNVKYSVVVQFTHNGGTIIPKSSKSSNIYYFTYEENVEEEELYNISFNEKYNIFELSIKNYFYDYRNEPSIDVKISFDSNPDYNLIAQNTFGTIFGSENRLFLAGHIDYPNIDRYNVSNDLLGDNVKSQSYETTYFPSKNYRVVGGKGAINGYVIATDTQLYVTKKHYQGDSKLFIRERINGDNGLVSYFEFKTSINKTPINNKSIIRFYNDILILAKDGLYGIEISSNVLTNERMIKLRSGFINNSIIKDMEKAKNVFMVDKDNYLYIVLDNIMYVADARYTAVNQNNLIENVSYEIVKWVSPFNIKSSTFLDEKLMFVNDNGNFLYKLQFDNYDDNYSKESGIYQGGSGLERFMVIPEQLEHLLKPNNSFVFNQKVFKRLAKENTDYVDNGNGGYDILSEYAFRNIVDGDKLYSFDNGLKEIEISGLEASARNSFILNEPSVSELYISVERKPLYITHIFDKTISNVDVKAFRLSPFKPNEIVYNEEYLDYNDYRLDNGDILNEFYINNVVDIPLRWISNVSDLDNNVYEKTMFRAMVYSTKKEKENKVSFGYRTMRRHDRFEEGNAQDMMFVVDLSNPFDFGEVNFNIFAMNTLNEAGSSFPIKEGNFLYIQFAIIAKGSIELNAIEIIYKLNRMLKTIS